MLPCAFASLPQGCVPGLAAGGFVFGVDKMFWRDNVRLNMKARFRSFLRRRVRRPRPRQLELSLWPKPQALSGVFLKKSAMTRKRR
jgi:hypothetical protein